VAASCNGTGARESESGSATHAQACKVGGSERDQCAESSTGAGAPRSHPAIQAAPSTPSQARGAERGLQRDADVEVDRQVESSVATAVNAALQKQAKEHAAKLVAATEREHALAAEVSYLTDQVTMLQVQLFRWQLACIALLVVSVLATLGIAHVALAYATVVLKAAAVSAAVAATASALAYAAVVALCSRGVQSACVIQQLIAKAYLWVVWALGWLWEMVSMAWSLFGGMPALVVMGAAALCVALVWQYSSRQRVQDRRQLEYRLASQLEAERQLRTEFQTLQSLLHAQLRVMREELAQAEGQVSRMLGSEAVTCPQLDDNANELTLTHVRASTGSNGCGAAA
jgi:hypothetical protein